MPMTFHLQKLVQDQFGENATKDLSRLLGRNPEQLRGPVDTSIGLIVDSFTSVAGGSSGQQILYNATQKSDDKLLQDPSRRVRQGASAELFNDGNKELTGIVGTARKDKILTDLQARSSLTKAECDKVLGYVAPAVIGAINSQLNSYKVANSPEGIGTLFNIKGSASSTVAGKNKPPGSGPVATSNRSGAASGGTASTSHTGATSASITSTTGASGAGSASWLTRWLLPLILLLGLLMLGLKSCSDQERQSKTISELASARDDVETANANINSLQSDYDGATANIESLNTELEAIRVERDGLDGELQKVSAELVQVKNVPTDTAELQGLLASTTRELDSSQANYESTLAALEANQRELAKVTTSRDESQLKISETEAANQDLTEKLDAALTTNTDLQNQLGRATQLRTSLEQKITETSEALHNESAAREADITRLSAQSTELQGQFEAMLGMRDDATNSLALRTDEVTTLTDNVSTLEKEVASLEQAKAAALTEVGELGQKIELLSGELENTQTELDATNATLTTTKENLATTETSLENTSGELAQLTSDHDNLTDTRDSLLKQIAVLNDEKHAALAQGKDLNGQLSAMSEELKEAQVADADAQEKLGLLNGMFSGLQTELGNTRDSRDKASTQTDQLRGEVAELNKKLLTLANELGTAQTEHNKAFASIRAERDDAAQDLETIKTTLNDEISSLEGQRDEALSKIDHINSDLQGVTDQKNSAQARIDEKSVQIESLETALKEQQDTVASLESSVATLEKDKASLQQAQTDADSNAANLNKEIETLNAALQSEQTAVDNLKSTIDELTQDKEGVTGERDQALATISSLEGELKDTADQVTSLDSQRESLQGQIDSAAAATQSAADETQQVRTDITDKLSAAGITSAQVATIEQDSAVSIVLDSGDLYSVGSAELTREGKTLLGGVGDVLAAYPDWRLDVEGHTDSQGIGAQLRQRFPTNWELSSARASAAVRHLNAKSSIDAERMSARGFAETKPVDSNETAAGRKKNRRVELILRR